MAKMVSPAGEMEVRITGVTAEGDQLVLVGKFGAWESKIYMGREEVAQVARMMLNWPLVRFLLLLPLMLLGPWMLKKLMRGSSKEATAAG